MADLYLGASILLVVCVLAYLLAAGVAARCSLRGVRLSAAVVVLLILAWEKWVDDSVLMTGLLPVSNLVIVGKWQTILIFILAALAWSAMQSRRAVRVMLVAVLLILGYWRAVHPLLAVPPPLANRWRGVVCMQTSDASCSAAAAATLLRRVGIAASEHEMAELCRTTSDGTSMHGLYRGLKLKLEGTDWDVAPFRGSVDTFLRQVEPPAIVSLGLAVEDVPHVDPRYTTDWRRATTGCLWAIRPSGWSDGRSTACACCGEAKASSSSAALPPRRRCDD
jgi:hypothetical protein